MPLRYDALNCAAEGTNKRTLAQPELEPDTQAHRIAQRSSDRQMLNHLPHIAMPRLMVSIEVNLVMLNTQAYYEGEARVGGSYTYFRNLFFIFSVMSMF